MLLFSIVYIQTEGVRTLSTSPCKKKKRKNKNKNSRRELPRVDLGLASVGSDELYRYNFEDNNAGIILIFFQRNQMSYCSSVNCTQDHTGASAVRYFPVITS